MTTVKMRWCVLTLLLQTIGVANAKSCGVQDVMNSAVENPAVWMKTLADTCGDDFKTKRFTEILLPGSHDAGAWRTGTGFNWYCDALALVGYDVCNNWFITQTGDLHEQLSAGARFLDFRAHWNSADDIRHDNFGGDAGCSGLDCWKIWHPPPHGGEFGPIRVPAGLDMTSVSTALSLIKNFMKENPTEVVVVDMKLQQVSDKEIMSIFGYDKKITKQRLKLLSDFLKKELGDVIFNGETYTGQWWHETVGSVMDSGKPLILQITGDTDELEGGDLDDHWLRNFIIEKCYGNQSCKGEPIWAATYADSCCNDTYIIEDQVDKRKVFVENYATEPADKRPLMELVYQVTYPKYHWQDGVKRDNLRNATAILRNREFDFYNQMVKEDGEMQSFPIANIVGMDFVTDCPAAVVALAVCGSVLQHDEQCKKEYLPANTKCLSAGQVFEVPLRQVSTLRRLWAFLGVLIVVYICLLCGCSCAYLCSRGRCQNGYYWIQYLSVIGILCAYDEYEEVPRGAKARERMQEDGSYTLLSASE